MSCQNCVKLSGSLNIEKINYIASCDDSDPILQTLSEQIGFERRLSPKAVVELPSNSAF